MQRSTICYRSTLYLSTLLCSFGTAALVARADSALDLAGKWKVAASTDDGTRQLTWTFSNDGDKLKGESYDPENAQRRELDRITLKGKTVKLEVDIEQDGNQGTIVVDAEEESPGKLVGKWSVVGSDGTEYLSGKITAVKEVKLAGEWLTQAVLPSGETMESVMKLTGENSALKGTVDGQAGKIDIDKLKATDNQLKLEFDFEMEGNTINCVIQADAKGSSELTGQWTVIGDDGSEVAAGQWSAVRKATGLAGVWDVTASVPDNGDYSGTLTLKESNGKYSGQSKASSGEAQTLTSVDVSEGKLTFTVPFEYEGNRGTITVSAKQAENGSLAGEWALKGEDGNEYARDAWKAVRRK